MEYQDQDCTRTGKTEIKILLLSVYNKTAETTKPKPRPRLIFETILFILKCLAYYVLFVSKFIMIQI